MTIGEIRRQTTARLRPVAGDLAALEGDRMLGFLMNCGPTELTLRAGNAIQSADEEKLATFVADRLTGRPLAYVIGHVEFYGLDLLCDPRALIPRPETEELVAAALDCLPEPRSVIRPLAVDIGTGSGNIALAMANQRPDLHIIGTDIDRQALILADENRRRLDLGTRVQLVGGRSLTMFRPAAIFDLIVSNPPYVVPGDPNLDRSVVDFEPHVALFAGPSGLEILFELLVGAEILLKPGGWVVSEIGFGQGNEIRDFLRTRPIWGDPVIHRDLAYIERILTVQRRR
ncbi:MAG: peptide chain release factor N(5)-glutamine methyltransferase [candidate division Zixibacteria bacterium]|nr:peptide chain release factor N(5)-glutamine methyltransferase [candidate division Zixibacteria bacterium]